LEYFKKNPFIFDLLLITSLYIISYGLILINNGIFWDDWVFFDVSQQGILFNLNQRGLPWVLFPHYVFLILGDNAIVVYRFFIFISYYATTITLYLLLKENDRIDRYSRLFIILIFLVVPLDLTRISFSNFPYNLSYFLFFLGFLTFIKYAKSLSNLFRILSLSFFSLSLILFSAVISFYYIIFFYLLIFSSNIYDVSQNAFYSFHSNITVTLQNLNKEIKDYSIKSTELIDILLFILISIISLLWIFFFIFQSGLILYGYILIAILIAGIIIAIFYQFQIISFKPYLNLILNILNGSKLEKIAKKYLDFILLPFIIYFIGELIFKPYGEYINYHVTNFDVSNPLSLNIEFFQTVYYELFNYVYNFLNNIIETQFAIAILLSLYLLLIFYIIGFLNEENSKWNENLNYFAGLIFGIVCIFFAGFIFMSLLPINSFSPFLWTEWGSRHLILYPLGFSFLIVFGGTLIFKFTTVKKNLLTFFLLFLIISCAIFNVITYTNFYIDGIKQESIIENLKDNYGLFSNSSRLIIFQDNARSYNAIQRDPRYYEYSALVSRAVGDQQSLAMGKGFYDQFKGASSLKEFFTPSLSDEVYHIKNFNFSGNYSIYLIEINEGDLKPTIFTIPNLIFIKIINQSQYKYAIKEITNLRINKIN
jgi:hypothetical protein